MLDPIGKPSFPHYDSVSDMIHYWPSMDGYEMVPIAERPKSITALTTDSPGQGIPKECMFDSTDGYQVSNLDENGNPIIDDTVASPNNAVMCSSIETNFSKSTTDN